MLFQVLPHLYNLYLLALQSAQDLFHRLRLHFLLHGTNTQSDHMPLANVVILFLTLVSIGLARLLVPDLLLEAGRFGLALHFLTYLKY